MKRLILVLLGIGYDSAYANCLKNMQRDFSDYSVYINYDSKEPKILTLQSDDQKRQCRTNYKELINYLEKYKKSTIVNQNLKYTVGWNYLQINGKVLYNILDELNYLSINNDAYTEFNTAKYIPISIVNNWLCYNNTIGFGNSEALHTNFYQSNGCYDYTTGDNLKLTQIINEKDFTKKLLQSKYIKAKINKNTSSINNLAQLKKALTKVKNDEELTCVIDYFSNELGNFAITKLNSDKTINMVFNLTGESAYCMGKYVEIEISHIKPKQTIYQFIKL